MNLKSEVRAGSTASMMPFEGHLVNSRPKSRAHAGFRRAARFTRMLSEHKCSPRLRSLHHKMPSTILRIAIFRRGGAERLFLTVTDRLYPVARDA